MAHGTVQLTRDCVAIQIPGGNKVTLKSGTEVYISQTLGGTYSVHGPGGLYRLTNEDADALGLTRMEEVPVAESTGPVNEELIWEVLRSCYDPEIPVNIVDLGLVYDLNVEKLSSGQHKVFVKMTLTAPGCGMGTVIAGDAQQKILQLPGVEEAAVEIVWDPPWHQSMITAKGREILGL